MSLIEAPAVDPALLATGESALARARSVETIEAAYAAWDELRLAARAVEKQWAEERRRLDEQGRLLLGAAKVALGAPAAEGLAPSNAFVTEAQAKLDAASRSIELGQKSSADFFATKLKELRAITRERVARFSASQPPVVNLAVRALAGGRKILHLRRLTEDESVKLQFVLTGRIPSRYGFLLDDSADDLSATPPTLYADEGVTDVRAPIELLTFAEVWPVKGALRFQLHDGRWVRWVARGAVLEAEVLEGEGSRNVLAAEEAETITGALLAAQLAGKLVLQLVRD